jgi:hypothetical protein
MRWYGKILSELAKEKITEQREVLYLFDTCSNIASPNLLTAGLMTHSPLLQKHKCHSIISTLQIGYWRELYREACQDFDNLNLLACTLVGVPYSWSVGHEFQSPAGQNLERLKVPKCEIFDRSDFHDFYPIKSLWEGDFGVKIKCFKKNI